MARDITTALGNALSAGVLRPAFFVQVDVDGSPPETVYVWTGIGTISWAGHDWLGVGNLGTISQIGETSELAAEGIQLSLSAIPADQVSLALSSLRQGRAVKVWLAMLDNTGAIIADPYQSFGGRVDAVEMDEGGDTATLTISAENRLIDLQRAREIRYTHDSQQALFAGDMGFEYVSELQEKNIMWGRSPVPIPQIGGDGGGGGDGGDGGGMGRLVL